MGEIILIIIAFGMVISGALGVILPFLPGVPVSWFGLLLFAYATNFAAMTWKALWIFLGLSVLTFVIDLIAPLIGAKQYKTSQYGMLGAMLGFLFGFLIFGPIGVFIGPAFGAIAGEIIYGKSGDEALLSSRGLLLGFLAGAAIKLSLIFVMLGYMIFSLF